VHQWDLKIEGSGILGVIFDPIPLEREASEEAAARATFKLWVANHFYNLKHWDALLPNPSGKNRTDSLRLLFPPFRKYYFDRRGSHTFLGTFANALCDITQSLLIPLRNPGFMTQTHDDSFDTIQPINSAQIEAELDQIIKNVEKGGLPCHMIARKLKEARASFKEGAALLEILIQDWDRNYVSSVRYAGVTGLKNLFGNRGGLVKKICAALLTDLADSEFIEGRDFTLWYDAARKQPKIPKKTLSEHGNDIYAAGVWGDNEDDLYALSPPDPITSIRSALLDRPIYMGYRQRIEDFKKISH
jgi:hypothetical protein